MGVFLKFIATLFKALAVVLLLLLLRCLLWLLNMFVRAPFDPLRMLPGPEGTALQNHFREAMDPNTSVKNHKEWVNRYGKTFRFHGWGKHDYRLMSSDFRVISHIFNSTNYQKPWQTRQLLARLIGRGLFSVEGTDHKLQRKIVGPALTTQSVKMMTPVFFQKAEELCDKWRSLVPSCSMLEKLPPGTIAQEPTHLNTTIVDIAHWVSRAAFDVIGLAGFSYNFHAVHDETETVYLAYRRMFDVTDKTPDMKSLLILYFPFLEKIWPDEENLITVNSQRIIAEAGKELIAKKKNTILAEKANAQDIQEKDILSLLIKSNLSTDPSKRLSDSELIAQCSTFLLAGADTVSLSLTWCLHFLSKSPEVQTRLRNEIMSCSIFATSSQMSNATAEVATDESLIKRWEALQTLPFLDAVVRETLRCCPPVHATIRVALADDRIPISDPIVLRDGTTVHKDEHISIRKGSFIHIPIEGVNYSEEIWGSDAPEFNPDRWSNLPPKARAPHNPGLGNLLTFGFGPHACIGYKFSIAEMKVFIATIIPLFVFKPVDGIEIKKFNAILTKPYVKNEWSLGPRLPVVVSRFTADEHV